MKLLLTHSYDLLQYIQVNQEIIFYEVPEISDFSLKYTIRIFHFPVHVCIFK